MNATTTGAAASEIGESTMPNIPTTSTAPRPTQSQFAVAPSEAHSESSFIKSIAATRKTRKLRAKKLQPSKPACTAPDDIISVTEAEQELKGKHGDGSPTPGPCILNQDGQIEIAYNEKSVPVTPGRSLEYALILCLVIYFVLDISYPHAFGQTLGLLQTVLLQDEEFHRCLMSFKLKALIKQLKPIMKK
ncbi:hypothetical protein HPB48_018406 [Haemaphysalis longicornis]|uniref:Uncharacterized protein n=1 Tax=Haemaphysalis longicornis TaxID=44386 RepID=A0A9J6GF05_HAELO|nr:hypothetical protein HPB48_018406 [Haemaphysalis longicornis]